MDAEAEAALMPPVIPPAPGMPQDQVPPGQSVEELPADVNAQARM